PGVRSNESIYPGKSPKKACIRLLILAVAAAGVAGAFAASVDFRTWLRVEPAAAPRTAALSGGVATLLLVCAAWIWTSRFRWVARGARLPRAHPLPPRPPRPPPPMGSVPRGPPREH